MSFEWRELGQTLRDDTFATWFGWSVIIAIIIFPVTGTIQSCYSESVKEDMAAAKLEAEHGDRESTRTETMKWLVTRGVHPLVARCAIMNSPATQCATMMNNLEDEDRSIIKELIANPAVTDIPKAIETVISTPVRTADDYTQGLDFGSRSPAE